MSGYDIIDTIFHIILDEYWLILKIIPTTQFCPSLSYQFESILETDLSLICKMQAKLIFF